LPRSASKASIPISPLFRALKLGRATLVAPIDKLSVVLVALFGVVFLGERPSLNGWIGIALIAAGAVIIAVTTADYNATNSPTPITISTMPPNSCNESGCLNK
jgi:hypothetical protein